MPDFWQGIPSIRAQYGQDFHAFELFGPIHIAELSVFVCLGAAIICFYRHAEKLCKQRILRIITALMLMDEITKYIVMAVTGQWS